MKFNRDDRLKEQGDFPDAVGLQPSQRILCEGCQIELPFNHFDSCTDPLCSKCRDQVAKTELAEIKSKQFDLLNKELLSGMRKGSAALPRLETIFAQTVHNLGGEKVVAALWSDQLKMAMKNRPGSHGVLQMLHAFMKLNLELTKRQQQENIIDLSDKQLEQKEKQIQASLLQNILADPSMVALLLEAQRATQGDIKTIPGVVEEMESQANESTE